MNRRPTLVLGAAALPATVLSLVVVGGIAGAGTNVWTDSFPHPARWKGHPVKCTAKSCVHASRLLVFHKNGLRYRTAARVTKVRGGYGLAVQVEISVTDGVNHGVLNSLSTSGSAQSLVKGGSGWGYLTGLRGSSHTPQIRPGQRRLLKTAYPGGRNKTPIRRGLRFRYKVGMSSVVHYNPRRSESPEVAVIELTVPITGPPTIRLLRPKP